nr:aminoacyltransferase [Lachnospiraceae bacterium]
MISAYSEKKWIEAIGHKEDGKYTEYIYKSDLGEVVYHFYKRTAGNIDGIEYYDIASYRGAAGPKINRVKQGATKQLMEDFLKMFSKYCEEEKIIAEFAKLDPWDENADIIKEVLEAEFYGNYYCCDLTGDFYEKYNRNAKRGIKKAIAGGVYAKVDTEGETIHQFIDLYKNTETKHTVSDYYKMTDDDVRRFFDIYGENVFLINAWLKDRI